MKIYVALTKAGAETSSRDLPEGLTGHIIDIGSNSRYITVLWDNGEFGRYRSEDPNPKISIVGYTNEE